MVVLYVTCRRRLQVMRCAADGVSNKEAEKLWDDQERRGGISWFHHEPVTPREDRAGIGNLANTRVHHKRIPGL